MFILLLFSNFQYFISWIVIIVFSVCLHELFHALAAYWQGDTTAKDQGYFTMDPVKHMGVTSLIMLVLMGLCWGSCPVNPTKFKSKNSDAIISFAGPFANFMLVILFAFLYVIFDNFTFTALAPHVKTNLLYVFKLGSQANAALAILNMIPLPPLDGSKIAAHFFPSMSNFNARLGNAGFGILFALFYIIPGFSYIFWQIADSMVYNTSNIILLAVQLVK
jgi:Zn-dependent protease